MSLTEQELKVFNDRFDAIDERLKTGNKILFFYFGDPDIPGHKGEFTKMDERLTHIEHRNGSSWWKALARVLKG